ncbi:MAG: hypothetical protein ACK4MI_06660 [Brevundimonas sp.]|uniref:hypothetical protein n=1 Tax=Brevundimonas sp. TaxID=1871086 RepID=UPI0028D2D80C|nr:hypothetical protein [uncultured Brevundimonas sp.]
MSRKDLSLAAIFGAPIVLFVLSLVGLIGALLEDGLWDALGAAFLATTVLAIAWALIRRRR